MNISTDITYEQIVSEIRKEAGSPVVFTNGCFDIIHPGHIQVLKRCRDLAGPKGIVVVGLNSDDSVRMNKGVGRPFIDENARATVVLSLRYVDHLVIFTELTPIDLIRALKPDVIVKGGDYKREDVVGREQAIVVIAPTVEGYSTTKFLERLR